MKTASICTFAAALGLANLAMAQVNVIVTSNGSVVSTATGTTFNSYTVSIDNTGPGDITAFEIRVDGLMNQVQMWDGETSIGTPSHFQDSIALTGTTAANRMAIDSHLLFDSNELIVANFPDTPNTMPADEAAIVGGSSNDGGGSRRQALTNYLQTGTSAPAPSLQANQMDIFQIVLPLGGSATVSGKVAVEGETNARIIGAVVPEPASLGLLAIGGLALARRRMA